MNHRLALMSAVATSMLTASAAYAQAPKLPGVGDAMQQMIDKNEIAGAVTVVVTKDKVLHLEATGNANIADKKAMSPDTVFRIASMTKPITGTAVMMLQDDGKLNVNDPVSKYIPEFANLKTPSGKPANLTLVQILTHTSGLGEGAGPASQQAKTLADLVPVWLAAPMQYEPGSQWKYTQSGINAACRVVEVVSGMTFDQFLQKRLFDPLGMKNSTFYPTAEQRSRLATTYTRNREGTTLEPQAPPAAFGPADRPPLGNGGLYSTAPDYARFCQMLLNGGTVDGHKYLSPAAMKFLTTPQTPADMPTGFIPSARKNYAWGIATCIMLTPHEGVGEALSPGSYGHGGAWGTQAWVDPVKGVAYVMMVQRSFPNSDESVVRRAFQAAAAKALPK